jgi:hypothetical protein
MTRLDTAARAAISAAGLSVAAYTREWWPDGTWHGDVCGCTDDRCVGYHHAQGDECTCLAVQVAQPPLLRGWNAGQGLTGGGAYSR